MLVFTYIGVWVVFFLFCCYYQSQVHRSSDECFRTKEFLSLHSLKWKKVLTGNGSPLTLTICSRKDLIVSAAFWIVKGSIVEGISLSSKIRTLPFPFFWNLCANLPRPICVWTCISNCLRTSYLYEVLCRHPVCLNLLLSLSPLCVLRSWSSRTNLFLLLLYPPCFWKTMLSDNMVFRIGGVHIQCFPALVCGWKFRDCVRYIWFYVGLLTLQNLPNVHPYFWPQNVWQSVCIEPPPQSQTHCYVMFVWRGVSYCFNLDFLHESLLMWDATSVETCGSLCKQNEGWILQEAPFLSQQATREQKPKENTKIPSQKS